MKLYRYNWTGYGTVGTNIVWKETAPKDGDYGLHFVGEMEVLGDTDGWKTGDAIFADGQIYVFAGYDRRHKPVGILNGHIAKIEASESVYKFQPLL